MKALVLLMLLSLPPAYVDRDEIGRDARMSVIAGAIAEVSDRASCVGEYASKTGCVRIWDDGEKKLAALLVTKGWHESRFARHVHAGECKPDECDAVVVKGIVFHRARSPWQLQRTAYSDPEWSTMVGTSFEATRDAAWAAAKVLAEGQRRCKSARGALSWYGWQRCEASGVGNRLVTYERLMKEGIR
jgi:hypothetical protein